jgi:hypothetical protein
VSSTRGGRRRGGRRGSSGRLNGGRGRAAANGGRTRSAGVGRVEVTPADVRVDDRRAGVLALDGGGDTSVSAARAARDTWLARVRGRRVVRVQPERVRRVIVPERKRQDLYVR